jgi:ZIP family zinc transporter
MQLPSILFAAFPVISTFLGGYIVLRWKRDLHPWLSLSGGLLLGVAFLDLLPEAMDRGRDAGYEHMPILAATLGAIIFFHILDKVFSVHEHHEHPGDLQEHCDNERHTKTKAWVRASGMVLHSVCDGLAIGGGFAVNYQLGLLIATAVVVHDFSDGMSTVTILKSALGNNKNRSVTFMLALDAIAPFVGALIGSALAPDQAIIAFMLASFSGFFIFLALSELLPQAHAGNLSRRMGVFLTILGIAAVVFIQSVVKI